MIEQIEPSERVLERVDRLLEQNRMILEHNLEISRLLPSPKCVISDIRIEGCDAKETD